MLKETRKRASGRVFFRAEGLSLERLLNQGAQEGLRLRNVRRAGGRGVVGEIHAAEYGTLAEIAQRRGWRLTRVENRGVARLKPFITRRALLWSGLLVFLALVVFGLNCVWAVDIQGAGPYEGEIARILNENQVRPGRFFFTLGMDELQGQIERALPGLAWVGVNRSGATLSVRCVQAVPSAPIQEGAGNVYAIKDGIVISVAVYGGTARVKAGDAVFAGQLLIEGVEQDFGGATTAARAQGSVKARVWYQAQAELSRTEWISVPTGRETVLDVLCTAGWAYPLKDFSGYEIEDVEILEIRLGGLLPIWLRRERHLEVQTHAQTRPQETVAQEAERAALRLAMEKVPSGVQILDKWTEYSMIKDGCIRATAVVETLEEIAAASP